MGIASEISTDDFTKRLGEHINLACIEAAEPIIQQAMKDIEEKLRGVVMQRMLETIETNYSMEKMGHNLVITLRQVK